MQPDPYERFWKQLAEVRDKQPGKSFGVWPPDAQPGSGVAPEYVYEAGKVLCRREHTGEVRARLGVPAQACADVGTELSLVTLPAHDDVIARVREVNSGRAFGYPLATPHHLVSITPVNMCPADEPVPVAVDAPPWPPRAADPSAGRGITILVVDTGMIDGYRGGHPWLAGVAEPPPELRHQFFRKDSFEPPTPPSLGPNPPSRLIKEYAGHGTFIAGVIGCVAPGATIQVQNALQDGGALLESQLGQVLLTALGDGNWPHIISLSAGAPTMDGLPLIGLEPLLAKLADHPDTLLVAAAGNDARRDDAEDGHEVPPYHFWPAAYAPTNDGVISVGALRRQVDGRACFTNHGTSVTVYARGEEHINAFLSGEYEYHHGLDPHCHNYDPPLYCPCSCVTSLPYHGHAMFQGMARWSGTSFATPLVAGMVAVHMRETGEGSARLAAHDLIAKKAHRVTDVDGEQLRAFL